MWVALSLKELNDGKHIWSDVKVLGISEDATKMTVEGEKGLANRKPVGESAHSETETV